MKDAHITPNSDEASTIAHKTPLAGLEYTVFEAIKKEDRSLFLEQFEPHHPADIADFLEQLNQLDRETILRYWGHDLPGEVLSELEEGLRSDVLEFLPNAVVSQALLELETDDVVDLVEDMEAPQRSEVLEALEAGDQLAVRRSLEFPENSAGRLMQRELVLAPPHWSAGDAIDDMRRDEDLPAQFYQLVIVDPIMRPIGTVPLHRLISSNRNQKLSEIMDEDFRSIHVDMMEEDVAYIFNQYHLISAPVIDANGRLIGLITIDDAMVVLEEQADEDIKRLGGVGDESLNDTVMRTTSQRFPWLAVNLITSILASIVIAQFSEVITAVVALAVLMPIVASMGGNAGTQSLTVAVRALATKDLTRANTLRIIKREAVVGFLNGLIFALLIGLVGVIWYGSWALGLVIGIAMIGNLLVAGLAGILIPIILERLKVDPALASAAFVTTVTDVVGFFAFLGLASLFLI